MPITKDYNYKTGKYESYCRFCGEKITGRLTKKFCDNLCRSRYRNEINSFIKKFQFKTVGEAHNYFLLVRELKSREILAALSRTNLDILGIDGFDFRVPLEKFIGPPKRTTWFNIGNLFFRVFPQTRDLRVRHFSKVEENEMESRGKISLQKAYPELELKTRYQGSL